MQNSTEAIECGNTIGAGQKDKSLLQLQGVIRGSIQRYSEAIGRYSIMNNGLTGCEPETETNEKAQGCSGGLIYEVIEDAERLRQLCNCLDNENNRLNTVIADG